jgi:hypothetical protein
MGEALHGHQLLGMVALRIAPTARAVSTVFNATPRMELKLGCAANVQGTG